MTMGAEVGLKRKTTESSLCSRLSISFRKGFSCVEDRSPLKETTLVLSQRHSGQLCASSVEKGAHTVVMIGCPQTFHNVAYTLQNKKLPALKNYCYITGIEH